MKQEAVSSTTELLAQIIAYQAADIGFQVGGTRLRRAFQEGATVKEGKLLATIYKVPGDGRLERTLAISGG